MGAGCKESGECKDEYVPDASKTQDVHVQKRAHDRTNENVLLVMLSITVAERSIKDIKYLSTIFSHLDRGARSL